MRNHKIPRFCQACIERLQAECSHEHYSSRGTIHYEGGETWDDFETVCDDCGADLNQLSPSRPSPETDDPTDEIQF